MFRKTATVNGVVDGGGRKTVGGVVGGEAEFPLPVIKGEAFGEEPRTRITLTSTKSHTTNNTVSEFLQQWS